MRLAVIGSGMIVADLLSIASYVDGLRLAAICGRETARPRLE